MTGTGEEWETALSLRNRYQEISDAQFLYDRAADDRSSWRPFVKVDEK